LANAKDYSHERAFAIMDKRISGYLYPLEIKDFL